MKKQILILEDLGITRENLNNLTTRFEEYNFINKYDDERENPDAVVGIINIKKAIGKEMINTYPNLEFIAVAFTGYDSVDLDECQKQDIAVYNVPDYSTDSVAELAIGLTISLLRDIPKTDNLIRSGGWNYPQGIELKGKRVGIVGTGTIGCRVAEIFKVLGCEVYGWSRTTRDEFPGEYCETLDELVNKCDIISIHVPSNAETEGMINMHHFKLMKSSSFLINTARGPVVNQKELTEALKNKEIAGAGIDVYEEEPINSDDQLLKQENSVLTPHIAYKTKEAILRRAEITFQNIENHFKGESVNKVH